MSKKSLAIAVSTLGLALAARSGLGVEGLAGLRFGPAATRAALIFSDDFQASSIKPQWSSNSTLNTQAEQVFSWFSGRYTGQNITLSLASVPPPPKSGDSNGDGSKYNLFTLTFDLFILDSWDGLDTVSGQDRFIVKANTVERFNEAFANVHDGQTFRRPDLGPIQLGFDQRYNDSIYRKIAVNFTVPDNEPMKIEFRGTALQGITDESWGMDNVRVSYEVVPAPGAASLACLGAGLLVKRRKR